MTRYNKEEISNISKLNFLYLFCSHVHLSYQWKQYYPRTELTNQISPLVEYHTAPFNVDQLEGTLQPRETKLVTFSFIPNKVLNKH